MIDLHNIHSLTDFLRNHKDFVNRIKAGGAEVLTINGKPELVLQSAKEYQTLMDRLDYMERIVGLRRAYKELEDGKDVGLEEAMLSIRTEHGF